MLAKQEKPPKLILVQAVEAGHTNTVEQPDQEKPLEEVETASLEMNDLGKQTRKATQPTLDLFLGSAAQ